MQMQQQTQVSLSLTQSHSRYAANQLSTMQQHHPHDLRLDLPKSALRTASMPLSADAHADSTAPYLQVQSRSSASHFQSPSVSPILAPLSAQSIHDATMSANSLLRVTVIVSNSAQHLTLTLPYDLILVQLKLQMPDQQLNDKSNGSHTVTHLTSMTGSVDPTALKSVTGSAFQTAANSGRGSPNITATRLTGRNSPEIQTSAQSMQIDRDRSRLLQQIVMRMIRQQLSPLVSVPETHIVLLTAETAQTQITLPKSLIQAAAAVATGNSQSSLSGQMNHSPMHSSSQSPLTSDQMHESTSALQPNDQLFFYDRGWTDDWISRHSDALTQACEHDLSPIITVGAPLLLPTIQSTSTQVLQQLQNSFPLLMSHSQSHSLLAALLDQWIHHAHTEHLLQLHTRQQNAVERAIRQCIAVLQTQLRALHTAVTSVQQFAQSMNNKIESSVKDWQQSQHEWQESVIDKFEDSIHTLSSIKQVRNPALHQAAASPVDEKDASGPTLLDLINESSARSVLSSIMSEHHQTLSRHAALQSSCAAVKSALEHIADERMAALQASLDSLVHLLHHDVETFLLPGCSNHAEELQLHMTELHDSLRLCETHLAHRQPIADLELRVQRSSAASQRHAVVLMPWFQTSYATMLNLLSNRCLPSWQQHLISFYSLMASLTRVSSDITAALQMRTTQQTRQDRMMHQVDQLRAMTVDLPHHYCNVLVEQLRRQHVENRLIQHCIDEARSFRSLERRENVARRTFWTECGSHINRPLLAAIGSTCNLALPSAPVNGTAAAQNEVSSKTLNVANQVAPHVSLRLSSQSKIELPMQSVAATASAQPQSGTTHQSAQTLTVDGLLRWLNQSRHQLGAKVVSAAEATLQQIQPGIQPHTSGNNQTVTSTLTETKSSHCDSDEAPEPSDHHETQSIGLQTSTVLNDQQSQADQPSVPTADQSAQTEATASVEPVTQSASLTDAQSALPSATIPNDTNESSKFTASDSPDSHMKPMRRSSHDHLATLRELQQSHETVIRSLQKQQEQLEFDHRRQIKAEQSVARRSQQNAEQLEIKLAQSEKQRQQLQTQLASSHTELSTMSTNVVALLAQERQAWNEVDTYKSLSDNRIVFEPNTALVGDCVLLVWSPHHHTYKVWDNYEQELNLNRRLMQSPTHSLARSSASDDSTVDVLLLIDPICLQMWNASISSASIEDLAAAAAATSLNRVSDLPPMALPDQLVARLTSIMTANVNSSALSQQIGLPMHTTYRRCKADLVSSQTVSRQ